MCHGCSSSRQDTRAHNQQTSFLYRLLIITECKCCCEKERENNTMEKREKKHVTRGGATVARVLHHPSSFFFQPRNGCSIGEALTVQQASLFDHDLAFLVFRRGIFVSLHGHEIFRGNLTKKIQCIHFHFNYHLV